MVIDPNNISTSASANAKGKLAQSERATAEKSTGTAQEAPSATGDSVSLSSEAQSLGKLEAAVASTPAVDSDKIAAAKSALLSGQYTIDADAIAGKLLDQDALL